MPTQTAFYQILLVDDYITTVIQLIVYLGEWKEPITQNQTAIDSSRGLLGCDAM